MRLFRPAVLYLNNISRFPTVYLRNENEPTTNGGTTVLFLLIPDGLHWLYFGNETPPIPYMITLPVNNRARLRNVFGSHSLIRYELNYVVSCITCQFPTNNSDGHGVRRVPIGFSFQHWNFIDVCVFIS